MTMNSIPAEARTREKEKLDPSPYTETSAFAGQHSLLRAHGPMCFGLAYYMQTLPHSKEAVPLATFAGSPLRHIRAIQRAKRPLALP